VKGHKIRNVPQRRSRAAYFFDSSALVKRYHPEVGTADVNRLISDQDSRHFIARLAVVEVQTPALQQLRRAFVVANFWLERQASF
jgi:predicted nucleic acid-binding protein